jgi:hypothetical protein
LRKRMKAACSEGGGVKVNGNGTLQGRRGRDRRRRWWHDSVYGLRKRTAVARSEARVEAAVGSEAGVEAVVDSEARDEVKGVLDARIEDGRRRWHDGV